MPKTDLALIKRDILARAASPVPIVAGRPRLLAEKRRADARLLEPIISKLGVDFDAIQRALADNERKYSEALRRASSRGFKECGRAKGSVRSELGGAPLEREHPHRAVVSRTPSGRDFT